MICTAGLKGGNICFPVFSGSNGVVQVMICTVSSLFALAVFIVGSLKSQTLFLLYYFFLSVLTLICSGNFNIDYRECWFEFLDLAGLYLSDNILYHHSIHQK